MRQKLLEAATDLSSERGFAELSLREIARRADVTPGMIAYYFGGKQGLYEAMLESVFQRILSQVQTLARAPTEGHEPVASFLRFYITLLTREPWAPQLLVREVLSPRAPLRDRFIERFASAARRAFPSLVRRGVELGRLRDDLDPILAMMSLVGMSVLPFLARPLLGEVLGYRLDGAFRNRWIEHTTRLFFEGAEAARPLGEEKG